MVRINLVFDYILWTRLNKILVDVIKSKRLLPIFHYVTYKQRIITVYNHFEEGFSGNHIILLNEPVEENTYTTVTKNKENLCIVLPVNRFYGANLDLSF